ncbi:MAG: CPBP family intramembrane metalloprotease [Spirochaetales bacterium]|nr:CPBP family intramembrane metalloprotease [Spirochaetales bacterium]
MAYYSKENARRGLPYLYLSVILLSAAVIFFYRHFEQFNPLRFWYLLPVWVAAGHLLCGFSYMITSLSPVRGIALVINSVTVYGKHRSAAHFQVAFLTSLFEEIIFRYFLLTVLNELLGNPFLAVLLAGLAFTVFHFRFGFHCTSIIRYLDFFIFSVTVGALNLSTGSFYPAFVIHGIRNYILKALLVTKQEYDELQKKTK